MWWGGWVLWGGGWVLPLPPPPPPPPPPTHTHCTPRAGHACALTPLTKVDQQRGAAPLPLPVHLLAAPLGRGERPPFQRCPQLGRRDASNHLCAGCGVWGGVGVEGRGDGGEPRPGGGDSSSLVVTWTHSRRPPPTRAQCACPRSAAPPPRAPPPLRAARASLWVGAGAAPRVWARGGGGGAMRRRRRPSRHPRTAPRSPPLCVEMLSPEKQRQRRQRTCVWWAVAMGPSPRLEGAAPALAATRAGAGDRSGATGGALQRRGWRSAKEPGGDTLARATPTFTLPPPPRTPTPPPLRRHVVSRV